MIYWKKDPFQPVETKKENDEFAYGRKRKRRRGLQGGRKVLVQHFETSSNNCAAAGTTQKSKPATTEGENLHSKCAPCKEAVLLARLGREEERRKGSGPLPKLFQLSGKARGKRKVVRARTSAEGRLSHPNNCGEI